ncbi:hypothetical protein F4801DRAFT_106853 [Xylaria longipes]|nr:hypothetical protein F4801DRAFT_106853 [Xylaria longipes]
MVTFNRVHLPALAAFQLPFPGSLLGSCCPGGTDRTPSIIMGLLHAGMTNATEPLVDQRISHTIFSRRLHQTVFTYLTSSAVSKWCFSLQGSFAHPVHVIERLPRCFSSLSAYSRREIIRQKLHDTYSLRDLLGHIASTPTQ